MTRTCRCGAVIPLGTLELVNHVASQEHADALAALGIVEHNHSARFVDSRGRPVEGEHPDARPYRRPGCPACEAESK